MDQDFYNADYEDTGDELSGRIIQQQNKRKLNQRNATKAFRQREINAQMVQLEQQRRLAHRRALVDIIQNNEMIQNDQIPNDEAGYEFDMSTQSSEADLSTQSSESYLSTQSSESDLSTQSSESDFTSIFFKFH